MSIIGLIILLVTVTGTFLIIRKTWNEFMVADTYDQVDQYKNITEEFNVVQNANKQYKGIETKKQVVKNFKTKEKK